MRILKLMCFVSAITFLSACSSLADLPLAQHIKPEEFLKAQPWIALPMFGLDIIFTQPSSTLIVFLAGLFAVIIGIRWMRSSRGVKSLYWFGFGLLLTGIGAWFAGVSYQAFGYELKCAGREFCTYTSWFEVIYLWLSIIGMNAMLLGMSFATFQGKMRKVLVAYALLNTLIGCTLIGAGIWFLNPFLVSFDFLSLLSAPSVLFMLVLHSIRRGTWHRQMRNAWIWFLIVAAAYLIALNTGMTQFLWNRGIWFSENDLLHLGLILWVWMLAKSGTDGWSDFPIPSNYQTPGE